MTKLDKTNWVTCTHDQMEAKIDAILSAAGFTRPPFPDVPVARRQPAGYVVFSVFETLKDPISDDVSDWEVKHPAFDSVFAEGKVHFDLGDDENSHAVLSKGYLNPTWADLLIEAERSCRGRGAPDLDHVFLEGAEPEGVSADGATFYTLIWGS